MPGVGDAALITRLDLPAKDLMSKLDAVVSAELGNDPAMESEVLTVGTEGNKETLEQTGDHEPVASSDLSVLVPENTEAPQPVTPDTPKIQESSNDKNVTQSAESENKPPSSQGDQALVSPSNVRENLKKSSSGNARPNRRRILSLDRGAQAAKTDDGYQSPDPTPRSDDERQRRSHDRSSKNRRFSKKYYDDASSSDDESSYFSSNLPFPKSGRSFSYSSTGSAHGRTSSGSFYQGSSTAARESDASLSFSSDDDDMHHHAGVHISPMIPPKGTVADMHLYPQRITRMHSVSSLVSSASSEDERPPEAHLPRSSSYSSMSSHTTNETSSDPSVRNELHDMANAAAEARPASHMTDASGRRSPVMGQHASPRFYYASPSPGLNESPLHFMQGYVPPQGVPHPQPQPMSHDQMAAWVSAGNAPQDYQGEQQPQGYCSAMQMQPQRLPGMALHEGGFRNIGDQSNLVVPFVYNEDVNDEDLTNRLSSGQNYSNGQISMNAGPGGNQTNLEQSQTPYGDRGTGGEMQQANNTSRLAQKVASTSGDGGDGSLNDSGGQGGGFRVYWQRWIMLLYMSLLNLLSDWTCYSVAPIALLTKEAFGEIDPELLVTLFLGANAFASACEPIILARLGLRRTVLFGALLLMIGSIVKSGGVPPILPSDLVIGHDEWRLYLGFFLVGLSQPLYQCTPALLSASWFPEKERTMATGVALNANQLGIGFAFIFGTILVAEKEDIIPYFGILSTLSTIAFLGTLIQFDDAPPTPPSSSARAMRGTLEVNLPSVDDIVQSVRGFSGIDPPNPSTSGGVAGAPSPATSNTVGKKSGSNEKRESKSKKSGRASYGKKGGATRRRVTAIRPQTANTDSGLLPPSPARSGPTAEVASEIARLKAEADNFGVDAPSPVMPGRVGQPDQAASQGAEEDSPLYDDADGDQEQQDLNQTPPIGDGQGPTTPQGQPGPYGTPPPGMVPPFGAFPHPHYQYPYWDPRMQQQMQQQQAYYQQQYYQYQQQAPPPPMYYYPMQYPAQYPSHLDAYDMQNAMFPPAGDIDEGAEPILTVTPHQLDIHIRDDQVLLSIRACMKRPGFIHALVAFTVSGIVINTLSTYMDYLVRLNGAPSYYTGIVGGTFQFVIMISSLIIGGQTDKTRAYYSVTIGMLVLGAFGLAECGVSLDADRGGDLRWSLVIVAALVGPLQPVSTEMGVDVVYPLSENTVLVIQQLFSNLLSAMFIPVFKALKDVGASKGDDDIMERPEYTFSFYLLIVLHTAATVFFATFNGKYLRYEHELQKKADEERKAIQNDGSQAFHPFYSHHQGDYGASTENERQPLVKNPVV